MQRVRSSLRCPGYQMFSEQQQHYHTYYSILNERVALLQWLQQQLQPELMLQ